MGGEGSENRWSDQLCDRVSSAAQLSCAVGPRPAVTGDLSWWPSRMAAPETNGASHADEVYRSRSAAMGSIRAARRAGVSVAAVVTTNIRIVTARYVSGSNGLVS